MELKPHDLVQIRGMDELVSPHPFPDWAIDSLAEIPFVVVRRAQHFNSCIPVGIRGNNRGERFGAYLSAKSPLKVVTPYSLLNFSNWQAQYEHYFPAAIESFLRIKPILDQSGYNWGPTGSAGFELATGYRVLKDNSDLDLVLDVANNMDLQQAKELLQALRQLALVRVDVQLNTPAGGVAMQEFIDSETVLIKTSKGPVLKNVGDIWSPETFINTI